MNLSRRKVLKSLAIGVGAASYPLSLTGSAAVQAPALDAFDVSEAARTECMYGWKFIVPDCVMAGHPSWYSHIRAVIYFHKGKPKGFLEESADGIDYHRVVNRAKYDFEMAAKIDGYDFFF